MAGYNPTDTGTIITGTNQQGWYVQAFGNDQIVWQNVGTITANTTVNVQGNYFVYDWGTQQTDAQLRYEQMYYQQRAEIMQRQIEAQFGAYPGQVIDDFGARALPEHGATHVAADKGEDAISRAKALLVSALNTTQRESFEKDGTFIVQVGSRRYVLGGAYPIRMHEDGNAEYSYCIHTYDIPKHDETLGFKLLLEANEDEFLRVANATRIYVPNRRMEQEAVAA